MKTFNRKPYEIDTTLKNISKYDNQLTFTGIKQSKNIYEVDQKSQMDTLNVYINDENTLVSREPLVEDELDIELDGELIDIKETNGVKVYVTKTETNYKIIAKRDDEIVELTATEYHLAVFNQYIICFRTEGAQVINTTDNLVWKSINDFIRVPVTKVITGSEEKIGEDINMLASNIYEEYYIRNKKVSTKIPDITNQKLSVEIVDDSSKIKLKQITEPNLLIDSRIINLLNVSAEIKYDDAIDNVVNIADRISMSGNIVAIGQNNKFLLSLDSGKTFITIYCPSECDNSFIRSLSDDGKAMFYVNKNGVFRCNLDDNYSWTTIYVYDDASNKINIPLNTISLDYHFKNADVFCFKIRDTSVFYTNVYFKGPGLWNKNVDYNDVLCKLTINEASSGTSLPVKNPNSSYDAGISSDSPSMTVGQGIKIDIDTNGNAYIGLIVILNTIYFTADRNTLYVCGIFGQGTNALTFSSYRLSDNIPVYNTLASINNMQYRNGTFNDGTYGKFIQMALTVGLSYYAGDNKNKEGWYFKRVICEVGLDNSNNKKGTIGTSTLLNFVNNNPRDEDAFENFPQYISEGIYINNHKLQILKDTSNESNKEPFQYIDLFVPEDVATSDTQAHNRIQQRVFVANKKYAIIHNGQFYINNLGDKDMKITIRYQSPDEFDKIPTLSYSGSELLLVFNNEIMISENEKNGSDILFYLPKINNQSFPNIITNILNISTSEIALFFKDNITICSKVTTDTGEAYTYSKTRLSLGVRYGDDVINTLDGANSMFPTVRGLAVMNYQAYMATTDQMLTFASDDIYELWNKFYNVSSAIKMIQMQNYIYLSNGTNEYLMFDIRTASWWRFEVPYNITKLLTDQVTLKLISNKLYKLNKDFDKNKYIDSDNNTINWYIISQRLHLGAINHYKNLKQLIFQLVQSNNYENTIDTEIKLYRKIVSYKEPDTIKFKVDEYRTFVKRFNYWKINELQWCLSNDNTTATPAQLILNGIDIKYEIGEEVR